MNASRKRPFRQKIFSLLAIRYSLFIFQISIETFF